jgi:membrane protease YdiL (CAAX protease family)
MNTKLSIQDVNNEFPMFDKKEVKHMISKIDRKRIFIFVAITYGITIVLAIVIFLDGGLFPDRTLLVNLLMAAMMFTPGIANIATRLITREGWSNTFLRTKLRRGWPFYLAALSLPFLAIIVGGAIYYLLFPGKFDLSMPFAHQLGIPIPMVPDAWKVVVIRDILGGYRTVLIGMVLFLGEEFGWRAYLLPKLMPLGSRKAVLLVGAIWGVFHWPLIFMGYEYRFDYWGAPVVGPLLFVLIKMFGDSVLLAWVTLRTGSVWPACIAHGVNNALSMLVVYFLRGEWDMLLGPSDVGIIGFLGYALLALPIFLIPGALVQPTPVPAGIAVSGAVEKAAVQSSSGFVS